MSEFIYKFYEDIPKTLRNKITKSELKMKKWKIDNIEEPFAVIYKYGKGVWKITKNGRKLIELLIREGYEKDEKFDSVEDDIVFDLFLKHIKIAISEFDEEDIEHYKKYNRHMLVRVLKGMRSL